MATVIAGIGSFFDLFDIFLAGVLGTVLTEEFHLSGLALPAVLGSGFVGMFVGATVLGRFADRFGKTIVERAGMIGERIDGMPTAGVETFLHRAKMAKESVNRLLCRSGEAIVQLIGMRRQSRNRIPDGRSEALVQDIGMVR